MLCDAMCDTGEQINWPTTIGNLGLWTRLGIPTKATHFKTHRLVRFLFCPMHPAPPKDMIY